MTMGEWLQHNLITLIAAVSSLIYAIDRLTHSKRSDNIAEKEQEAKKQQQHDDAQQFAVDFIEKNASDLQNKFDALQKKSDDALLQRDKQVALIQEENNGLKDRNEELEKSNRELKSKNKILAKENEEYRLKFGELK